jgi:hypothetical protein
MVGKPDLDSTVTQLLLEHAQQVDETARHLSGSIPIERFDNTRATSEAD